MKYATGNLSLLKSTSSLLKNPSFWILIVMTSFLILLYQFWPWRDFQFQGPWHWLGWLSGLDKLAIFECFFRVIGSLFIIPCIIASITFHLRGSVILSLLSLIFLLPLLKSMWQNPESWITNIIFLFLPVILTTIISVEFRLRSRDKKHYAELEKERQLHLSKILAAQEKARQRIAREIHDESIQTLLATASHTERLRSMNNIDEIKTKAVWIEKNIRSTVAELRRISLDLRPTILDDLGLVPAIRWLIQEPEGQEGTQIHLKVNGNEFKLPQDTELAVYRVIQEALNNVKKHSRAKNAEINLKFIPGLLTIGVRDDGTGFRVPRRLSGLALNGNLGLIDIQERIQLLGGKLVIKSKPKRGTLLTITIPIIPVP
jgi:two-component system, NarL family, sensor histidine kinase DegS